MSVDGATEGYRFLHTMLRVRDQDRAIDFYTRLLGMRELRQFDVPKLRHTLTFLGYGAEAGNTVIEIVHEWDRKESYAPGDAYGHIAIGVPDIRSACDRLRHAGIEVLQEPGATRKGGAVIAFVKDPEGYVVELIERP